MLTAQVRYAYPEIVTGGVTANWTVLAGGPICNEDLLTPVALTAGPPDYPADSAVTLRVHPIAVEAFLALGQTMDFYGYWFGESNGGTHSCRKSTVGPKTSIHAHGVALDLNPRANPQGQRRHNYPTGFPEALLGIKTKNGQPVFRWGLGFATADPMHWEPTACTRISLEVGIDWDTVAGQEEDDLAWLSKEAQEHFQAEYDNMMALKNPDGTANPAKPTSLGYVLREHRERGRLLDIDGNKPEEIAAATLDQ